MNLLLAIALLAQVPQPKLGATQPAGAKAGSTVEVRITSGSDLDRAERLVFSHPGITAEPVMMEPDRFFPEKRAVEGLFRVTVKPEVPPGIYEVRAAGHFGMSNARRFVVGTLPEAVDKEPNGIDAPQELAVGTTVNGTCDAQGYDVFKFEAKKGQRLIVDGVAQRIDSRTQLVLLLHDPTGRRLHRAAASRDRDPLLDFTVEADGAYTLRVHDATYRGGDEHFYRLTLSAGPWIDFADPPVVKAGTEAEVTLYGRNLPGGKPAEGMSIDGRPLEKLPVKVKAPADPSTADLSGTTVRPADSTADLFVYQLGQSNVIRLLASEEAPVREAETEEDPAKAKPVALPFHVLGRLYPGGDRDSYVFEAKKGDKLWIEIVSQRLGLPTDPALTVQQVSVNDKGEASFKDLQDVDDSAPPGVKMGDGMEKRYRFAPEDPSILWTAPADGRFRVLVRDLYGSSTTDPRYFYRLSIRPARPDFRLVAFPVEGFMAENKMSAWACVLRRGGAERFRVIAYRREGFDGPIQLEAENLPKGVSAKPVLLAPGDASGELLLHAAADAPGFSGAFKITGRAEVDGKTIARPARGAEIVWNIDTQKEGLVTRVTDRLGLAVDDRYTAPLAATLGTDAPLRMARGGKLKVPVKLVKNADFKDQEKAKVKMTPIGFPGGKDQKAMAAKEVTLEISKPDGEIEIDVTDKAPIGTFTFYVAGEVQVPFAKLPERVKSMEADKKRVDEVAKQIADEMKAAEKARAAADEKSKEAAKALEAARQQMAKAKKDPATANAADLEKAIKDAETAVQASEEAKKKAQEAEAKVKDLAKSADATSKKLADDMKKAADAAKEKPVKVWVASLPVSVEIVALPASLKAPAEPVKLKAGEKAEVVLDLVREFGFADEVKLELSAPGDAKLKLADGAAIAKDQSQAKVTISADKVAKPGKHAATLKGKSTFNGKPLALERAVTIEIEPAAAAVQAPEPPKSSP